MSKSPNAATLAQREHELRALIDVGLGADDVGGVGVNQELAVGTVSGEVASQHLEDEEGM
ncbi:hypothetical protein Dimus_018136, partial [Dionaea muscipula]